MGSLASACSTAKELDPAGFWFMTRLDDESFPQTTFKIGRCTATKVRVNAVFFRRGGERLDHLKPAEAEWSFSTSGERFETPSGAEWSQEGGVITISYHDDELNVLLANPLFAGFYVHVRC